ncbi:unnamed protein product [Periconia digitata]|uniref:Uncharacterized protein n=1 Tax=Periconia digitata TaxID=1303443 RepID=A0A9W4XHJ3_9PLEO|nr:unnamed protein product [Periconia digitata]
MRTVTAQPPQPLVIGDVCICFPFFPALRLSTSLKPTYVQIIPPHSSLRSAMNPRPTLHCKDSPAAVICKRQKTSPRLIQIMVVPILNAAITITAATTIPSTTDIITSFIIRTPIPEVPLTSTKVIVVTRTIWPQSGSSRSSITSSTTQTDSSRSSIISSTIQANSSWSSIISSTIRADSTSEVASPPTILPNEDHKGKPKKHTIVLGSIFGVLGAMVVSAIAMIYLRKRLSVATPATIMDSQGGPSTHEGKTEVVGDAPKPPTYELHGTSSQIFEMDGSGAGGSIPFQYPIVSPLLSQHSGLGSNGEHRVPEIDSPPSPARGQA